MACLEFTCPKCSEYWANNGYRNQHCPRCDKLVRGDFDEEGMEQQAESERDDDEPWPPPYRRP